MDNSNPGPLVAFRDPTGRGVTGRGVTGRGVAGVGGVAVPGVDGGVAGLDSGVVPAARAATDPRLLALLAQLAAASTTGEIADAAVSHAVALLGGRAGALGLLSAGSARVEIVGSVGYGCGMMSAGSSLDADADLPITRAATTGSTVVTADLWIAAPLAPAPTSLGALLVSLASPTQHAAADAMLVEEIAAHTRSALARLPRRVPSPVATESAVTASGVRAVVRSQPVNHDGGGDVVELWPAGDGSCWLLVADACGADASAAATSLAVAVAARALSTLTTGPAELLAALDRALADTPRADRFVTAVVARVRPSARGVDVVLATAGHPAPWRIGAAEIAPVEVLPEAPLNLRLGVSIAPVEMSLTLRPGEQLLFFTDGALDRASGTLGDDVLRGVAARLCALGAGGTDAESHSALAAVGRALHAAGGESRDDMALALIGASPEQ